MLHSYDSQFQKADTVWVAMVVSYFYELLTMLVLQFYLVQPKFCSSALVGRTKCGSQVLTNGYSKTI